jgi:hypothetical protein
MTKASDEASARGVPALKMLKAPSDADVANRRKPLHQHGCSRRIAHRRKIDIAHRRRLPLVLSAAQEQHMNIKTLPTRQAARSPCRCPLARVQRC